MKTVNDNLKYLSLLTLTGQNAVQALSMRYARARSGDMFFDTTAVFMSEVVKLITCLYLVFRDEGRDTRTWANKLYETIVINKMDTLKVCIPSALYLVQNNLLFVAASNLDVATYQITNQMKILTTAVFSVLMLNKTLIKTQWFSLAVLVAGVALVQLSDAKEAESDHEQSRFKGFVAAITASFLSGLAGVYFEKILKRSDDISVWMRNVQMSLLSLPMGLFAVWGKHGSEVAEKGFFFGYDIFVWYLVCLYATGGLLVAVVVKYADNILKGFACSLAIVVGAVFSMLLFGFQISAQFTLGVMLVISSSFIYNFNPPSREGGGQLLVQKM